MTTRFRRLGVVALLVVGMGVLTATFGHGDPPAPSPVLDPWLRAELLVSPAARRLPVAAHHRLQRALRPTGHSAPGSERRALEAALAGTPSDPPLACFLTGALDAERLRAAGVTPGIRSNGVWSARVPRAALPRLLRVQGLATVQLAPPVRLLLDRSLPAAGADTIHRFVAGEFSGSTGQGVIVGIVDSGIDAGHADFRRSDGGSRVLHVWDQNDTLGPPPSILSRAYGTEWSAADIEAGRSRIRDSAGHGTHVAGAAAGGGGAERRYVGMAPMADIVAVGIAFEAASVVDGVDYVFRRAEALGRPAVVNLSLGTQYGPHDGTAPFDRAIEGLVGNGRVVVAAAGNEAEDAIHAEIALGAQPVGAESELPFLVPPFPEGDATPFRFMDLDAWYGGGDECEVFIRSPGGERHGPFRRDRPDSLLATPEGHLYVGHVLFEGQSNFQLRLSNFAGVDPAFGTWRLLVRRLRSGDPAAEFDAWIAGYSAWVPGLPGRLYSAPSFAERGDPSEEINSPATAPSVIAVGSLNSRFCWPSPAAPFGTQCLPGGFGTLGGISPFSCRGPTRDGRPKPDLAAPGLAVVSTLSSTLDPELRALVGPFVAPDGAHWALGGTSMAAPHVTGAVALLLERFPGITLAEIQARLRRSAGADSITGPVYNSRWGFGRLHVDRLLRPELGRVQLVAADVSATDIGVRLQWRARPGSGETGFRLTRAAAPGGPATMTWPRIDPGDVVILDRQAPPGATAHYRLEAWLNGGELVPVTEWSLSVPPLAVAFLGPPLPNPSRDLVTLDVRIPGREGRGRWELVIFDLAGRPVRHLSAGSLGAEAEQAEVVWDGRDDRGGRVSAGLYLARLSGPDLLRVRRLIRLP